MPTVKTLKRARNAEHATRGRAPGGVSATIKAAGWRTPHCRDNKQTCNEFPSGVACVIGQNSDQRKSEANHGHLLLGAGHLLGIHTWEMTMSVKNKTKDRDHNGRIRRKYTSRHKWGVHYDKSPSWWVTLFMAAFRGRRTVDWIASTRSAYFRRAASIRSRSSKDWPRVSGTWLRIKTNPAAQIPP